MVAARAESPVRPVTALIGQPPSPSPPLPSPSICLSRLVAGTIGVYGVCLSGPTCHQSGAGAALVCYPFGSISSLILIQIDLRPAHSAIAPLYCLPFHSLHFLFRFIYPVLPSIIRCFYLTVIDGRMGEWRPL